MSYSRRRCMDCAQPPTHDVRWAEGMARAWFCDRHYQAFKRKHPGEIVAEHQVQGEVPPTWGGKRRK